MDKAIEVEKLRRTFKGRAAVDDISFSVEQGEIFGFLGPNGAGKTTTIRVLTGQLLPSGGSARVAGYDCASQAQKLKPFIGVVGEQQNLYDRMSGRENLAFFARLFGVSSRRVDDVLAQVGLSNRAKESVKIYSNGMKQRLLIARALLNQPQVLFLDEPTRGLDPGAARDIRQAVAALARDGTTVFLTTHYMEEADQLCSRVAFLNEGRIVALDTPQNLKIAHGRRQVKVMLKGAGDAAGDTVILSLDGSDDTLRLSDMMRQGQVLTIHSEEASLEDIFIQLAGRGLMQGETQ
jgi:ABC-2 type transport system ATP-binding protein